MLTAFGCKKDIVDFGNKLIIKLFHLGNGKLIFAWTLRSYHDLVKRDSNSRTNVLCKFETPRGCWPNGIVNQVYLGPDGLIRQVLVKTNSGLVKRHIRYLVCLKVCLNKIHLTVI